MQILLLETVLNHLKCVHPVIVYEFSFSIVKAAVD